MKETEANLMAQEKIVMMPERIGSMRAGSVRGVIAKKPLGTERSECRLTFVP